MSELRVGFIGTGRISDLHAIEYLQNPRARIVAVCDTVVELAQQRGAAGAWRPRRSMTTITTCWPARNSIWSKSSCRTICTARSCWMPPPPACTFRCRSRWRSTSPTPQPWSLPRMQAGVVFKVFENFIFYPPVMRAKALIDAGEIGDPLTIRIKSNSATSPDAWPIPPAAEAWRFTPGQCGGGPLVFDDGHHKFALGWHFMGQAEAVHAWIGETEREPGFLLDAPAIISWKFPGGRYGSLEVVYSRDMEIWSRYYAQDDRVEITGTRGVIEITRGHGKLFDRPPVILYRDRQTRTFRTWPSAGSRVSSCPRATSSTRCTRASRPY